MLPPQNPNQQKAQNHKSFQQKIKIKKINMSPLYQLRTLSQDPPHTHINHLPKQIEINKDVQSDPFFSIEESSLSMTPKGKFPKGQKLLKKIPNKPMILLKVKTHT